MSYFGRRIENASRPLLTALLAFIVSSNIIFRMLFPGNFFICMICPTHSFSLSVSSFICSSYLLKMWLQTWTPVLIFWSWVRAVSGGWIILFWVLGQFCYWISYPVPQFRFICRQNHEAIWHSDDFRGIDVILRKDFQQLVFPYLIISTIDFFFIFTFAMVIFLLDNSYMPIPYTTKIIYGAQPDFRTQPIVRVLEDAWLGVAV